MGIDVDLLLACAHARNSIKDSNTNHTHHYVIAYTDILITRPKRYGRELDIGIGGRI